MRAVLMLGDHWSPWLVGQPPCAALVAARRRVGAPGVGMSFTHEESRPVRYARKTRSLTSYATPFILPFATFTASHCFKPSAHRVMVRALLLGALLISTFFAMGNAQSGNGTCDDPKVRRQPLPTAWPTKTALLRFEPASSTKRLGRCRRGCHGRGLAPAPATSQMTAPAPGACRRLAPYQHRDCQLLPAAAR